MYLLWTNAPEKASSDPWLAEFIYHAYYTL